MYFHVFLCTYVVFTCVERFIRLELRDVDESDFVASTLNLEQHDPLVRTAFKGENVDINI